MKHCTRRLADGTDPGRDARADRRRRDPLVATGNTVGVFGRVLRALGYGDVYKETLDELGQLWLSNPQPQTVQRLTKLAARPPAAPISPTTQATTGGLAAGMTGMMLGRSTNEPPRPPLRSTVRPTRQQLLADWSSR